MEMVKKIFLKLKGGPSHEQTADAAPSAPSAATTSAPKAKKNPSKPEPAPEPKGQLWAKYKKIMSGRVIRDGERVGRIVAPLAWNYDLASGTRQQAERNIRQSAFMVMWDDVPVTTTPTLVDGSEVLRMVQDEFALVRHNP